jgi:hypothetical protein
MTETDIPVPNTEYRLEKLDDELLLYHPAATKTVFLNETACLIWQLCDGERSVGEIVELLRESVPELGTAIPSDVETALSSFAEHSVIEFK